MLVRTAKHGKEAAAAAVLIAALSFGSAGSASASAACPTDHGAKAQVAALVAQLHDVVHSHAARAHTRAALVQSMHAMRDENATTKAQRANFGQQISALAKTLHNATNKVERQAIIATIHALQAQKQRGPLTKVQRTKLKADNVALEKAVLAKADNATEIKAITAQFRKIHESFACTA